MAALEDEEDTMSRLMVAVRIRPVNQKDYIKSPQVSIVASCVDPNVRKFFLFQSKVSVSVLLLLTLLLHHLHINNNPT
jgi:hypothetical protein